MYLMLLPPLVVNLNKKKPRHKSNIVPPTKVTRETKGQINLKTISMNIHGEIFILTMDTL